MVNSNNKMQFHRKSLLILLDYFTIWSDLVRFEQILCFSKIASSIIPKTKCKFKLVFAQIIAEPVAMK